MKATRQAVRRHWPKILTGLLAVGLAVVFVRAVPSIVRYIKMERM